MGPMDAMEVFHAIHTGLSQEAPGSDASTLRALKVIDLPPQPVILDIGCGPGRSAALLAQETVGPVLAEAGQNHDEGGLIVGVDIFMRYLEATRQRANVLVARASMTTLPFRPGTFDLIWSEGAIYNMGFKEGVKSWRPLLKESGYLVLTEACWFTDERSREAREFWAEGYPAMTTIEENVEILKTQGYELLDVFPLPQSDWWTYYDLVAKRLDELSDELQISGANEGNQDHDTDEMSCALQVIEGERQEIELYRKYGHTYGYAFFICQPSS